MPRTALMNHPVRLHLLLEKETLKKLQSIAKKRVKTITELLRELAEGYAEGRIIIPDQNLNEVIRDIRAFRGRGPNVETRSEDLIRSLRQNRA